MGTGLAADRAAKANVVNEVVFIVGSDSCRALNDTSYSAAQQSAETGHPYIIPDVGFHRAISAQDYCAGKDSRMYRMRNPGSWRCAGAI